ncbi:TetR/AcrR family transcriptional regulator [Actinoplanes sp. NPDC051513]|uniref:TetR/AcrR family transcriptional regulator n=1 Tax=Actinoplanes sp. NPDC051513 TaxID=3363908 RepID=UPI0037A3D929
MPAPLPQSLRSDARDNRDRILTAARAIFAAAGLDVPLREIARRAGVGPATLYRHFPTKQALVTEAFAEQMHACHAVIEEGLAAPDPWQGLCAAITSLCELHARDWGFAMAFASAFPHAAELAAARSRSVAALAGLALRARRSGRMRADVTVDDLILMLAANTGLRATSPEARVAASRRFAELTIRALSGPSGML